MKLKTLQPVTNEQWKAQAERFSSIVDKVEALTFPKKDVENLEAIIEMDILDPLTKGFRAKVKYIQQFVEIVETTDEQGEPTQISITRQHTIVDYFETFNREESNAIIGQIEPGIPNDITSYLDRQDWIIQQAFIAQVVSKGTFGGLTANDYELIA